MTVSTNKNKTDYCKNKSRSGKSLVTGIYIDYHHKISIVTSKQLYEYMKKDNGFGVYIHNCDGDRNVSEQQKLEAIYRDFPSIENEKRLLDINYEIIYEQIQHPDLILARNYSKIKDELRKNGLKSLDSVITELNEYAINKFKTESKNYKLKLLKNKTTILQPNVDAAEVSNIQSIATPKTTILFVNRKNSKIVNVNDYVTKIGNCFKKPYLLRLSFANKKETPVLGSL